MSRILNVGVVGCGEVAQVIHLPNLSIDSGHWKVTALCDVSELALEYCGERFHVPKEGRFTSLQSLLSSPTPLDVLFILSPDQLHASQVIACANAGKHVLIEKPMAQTLAECDAIEEARQRNGVVIFVGYMRRYAAALLELKEAVKGKKIKYVRVRDIIGSNKFFTSQSSTHQQVFRDFPASATSDITSRANSNLIENLGEERASSDPRAMSDWALLGGLGSHDLSAMRDVLGMPNRCLCATRTDGDEGKSMWWNVIFEYDGFTALYEMAIDSVPIFDAHIEVYTNDSRIKIQYDSPYIKGLPITLTTQSLSSTGGLTTTTHRPTYADPYVLEMKELYDAIVHRKAYKTTPADAKNDVELSKMIMAALKD